MKYSISFFTIVLLLSASPKFNMLFAQNLNKAMELYDGGNYKEAASEFERAIPIYEFQYGKKDTVNLTKIIYYAGSSYELAGNSIKAKELYLKGINIYKTVTDGKKNPWYKTYLTTLSDLLFSQNELEETYRLLSEIKDNDSRYKGKNSKEYLESVSNLAFYHFQTGNFSKAQSLYTELKHLSETIQGKNNPEYAKICNNLAEIYRETDQIQNAESLYKEAASIYFALYGSNHISRAVVCNNMAVYYDQIGDYDKAEQHYRISKDIRENVLGTHHPDYALSCNNLGKHYMMLEMYTEAEPLFNEAKSIYEIAKTGNEIKYAAVCTNLAELYKISGKMREAEALYMEAFQISKDFKGIEDPDHATDCNNLGSYYRTIGQFDKAETYYLEALEIREKKFGRYHHAYITTCNNLGELYRASGDSSKATKYYMLANQLLNHNILKSSDYMSENEREKYLDAAFNYHFDVYYSYFLKDLTNKPDYSELVYNNALVHKSQLLRSNLELRHLINQSRDTSILNAYTTLSELRNILAYEYLLPLDDRRKDLTLIEERTNTIEKALIDKTIGSKNSSKLSGYTATWDAVQSKLEPSQAAIEFIRFRYRNKNGFTDSVFYYALIVLRNFETSPIPVYLFEESELESLIKRKAGTDTYRHIKNLYDPKSQTAQGLYNLIWRPIEPYLTNISSIKLSPVGLLNTIAFDAIPVNENTLLSDKHKLYYLNVTSELADRSKLYTKDLGECFLFGGIEFSMEPIEMIEKSKVLRNMSNINLNDTNTSNLSAKKYIENLNQQERNETWSFLPGSLTEAENISDILRDGDIEVKLFDKKNATEEQFKLISGNSPSLIHLSTHGFYFPVEDRHIKNQPENLKRYIQPDNPLFRSGIILAGGNNAFSGISTPPGVDDGVLTAYEIANLNLFNTKLVVLSACQTGLGDIKGFEGVYGMQRAFKNAGADYLLLSLWEVPDQQTQELMTFFYKKWCTGLDITDAFKSAQNEMKTKYAGVEGAAFAWAAFILIK